MDSGMHNSLVYSTRVYPVFSQRKPYLFTGYAQEMNFLEISERNAGCFS